MKTSKEKQRDIFELIEGAIPRGFEIDYEPSVFNMEAHRKLQSGNGWHSFHFLRKDKKKVLASVHFCVKDGLALSPYSAPYGSFELSLAITTSQLFEFIGFWEKKLRNLGVEKIEIKSYPEQYSIHSHNTLTVLLFNYQFNIKNAELGACIKITDSGFMDIIDPWEKRKLKQAVKAGLKFKSIKNSEIDKTYNFIRSCRLERGQGLSMTLKDLKRTFEKLERYFVLFGVYQENKLVAASIAIKVNNKVLYNFYSAHSKLSEKLSPMVLLINGVYSWCGKHRIELLDMGTSALGGKPNFSLIDFKLRLGAAPSMKLTFEKVLR